MKRGLPESFIVDFTLRQFSLNGTWRPHEAEREAAWELLVELSTRTSMSDLDDDQGTARAALSSLYTLFETTRSILRTHGAAVARSKGDGNLSFGVIAVRILNDVLRPLLSEWHPRLEQYEHERPAESRRSRMGAVVGALGRTAPCHRRHPTRHSSVCARPGRSGRCSGWRTPSSCRTAGPVGRRRARVLGRVGRPPARARVPSADPDGPLVRPADAGEHRAEDRTDEARKLDARRDTVAAPGPTLDHTALNQGSSGASDYWFDYIADIAGAFDPTMAVAWWAGRDRVEWTNFASGLELARIPAAWHAARGDADPRW